MSVPFRFALNHMVAPRLDVAGLCRLARKLSVGAIEIRNDLDGVAIADGTTAATIRSDAASAGVEIRSINALQRFNHWTAERADEARALATYAHDCGAEALVLCPVNDPGFAPPQAERLRMLREALDALRPILTEAGIIGLVEPLGFVECSLRLKREAVEAIRAVDGADRFKLVHDTFHHYVAGETEIFPAETGLVHVSGVVDPKIAREQMRDPHRVLVTADDRIDNIGQVGALKARGYVGLISFEPFAASVHELPDIEGALRDPITMMAGEARHAA